MKFSFFFFLVVGVPGGKIISTRVCEKIFLIKAKNKKKYFCTVCLFKKKIHSGIRTKNLKSKKFSGMGCLSFDGGGLFYPPFKNNFHIQN